MYSYCDRIYVYTMKKNIFINYTITISIYCFLGGTQCKKCKKYFKNSHTMKVHYYGCGLGANHSCTYCSAKFTRRYNLNRHIVAHHREIYRFMKI